MQHWLLEQMLSKVNKDSVQDCFDGDAWLLLKLHL